MQSVSWRTLPASALPTQAVLPTRLVIERPILFPVAEPLSLRLPRDYLVLHPMQGHLDVESVLLAPGLRCVIGSAEGCAVRLTKSALVQPEHCVFEIIGRKTWLTKWEPETTWLNDRLVSEPRELVSGDRIAIGPFDFQVRPASAEDLLHAKLIERESTDADQVDEVLRLKRAIDNSGRDQTATLPGINREPDLDQFGDLLREASDGSDSDTHERLNQHISKLLSDLQSQVLSLQEKEAELSEQLRSQREETGQWRLEAEPRTCAADSAERPLDSIPTAVRPDYEQVLQLLKTERDQLDQERSQLADEQAQWHEQQRDWSQRLQALESQLAELEAQRQAVLEERETCRALNDELMRDQARLAKWEDQLRLEERELTSRREEFRQREQLFSTPIERSSSPATPLFDPAIAKTAAPPQPALALWQVPERTSAEFEAVTQPSRPLQTLLTLFAFSLAALCLSGTVGDYEANTTVGWGTAIVGALSTVDLLLRRCLSTHR